MVLDRRQNQDPRVSRVLPHSPAAEAGVQVGDVLRQVDDTRVQSQQRFHPYDYFIGPGRVVHLLVVRKGNERRLKTPLRRLL